MKEAVPAEMEESKGPDASPTRPDMEFTGPSTARFGRETADAHLNRVLGLIETELCFKTTAAVDWLRAERLPPWVFTAERAHRYGAGVFSPISLAIAGALPAAALMLEAGLDAAYLDAKSSRLLDNLLPSKAERDGSGLWPPSVPEKTNVLRLLLKGGVNPEAPLDTARGMAGGVSRSAFAVLLSLGPTAAPMLAAYLEDPRVDAGPHAWLEGAPASTPEEFLAVEAASRGFDPAPAAGLLAAWRLRKAAG